MCSRLAVISVLFIAGCTAPFIEKVNINTGSPEAVAIDCPDYVPMPAAVKAFIAEHRKTAAADKPEVETWLRWVADDIRPFLEGDDCTGP